LAIYKALETPKQKSAEASDDCDADQGWTNVSDHQISRRTTSKPNVDIQPVVGTKAIHPAVTVMKDAIRNPRDIWYGFDEP